MAQHVRGTPVTHTGVDQQSTGVHPVVRNYVGTYRTTHRGKDPGTKHMLRALAACGLAPEVVRRSWRLLKAEREEAP